MTFLQDNGATGATAATVAVLVGESASQARHRLDALVRRGRAVRTSINGTVAYRAKHPSTSPETKGVEHVR
ncbi:hypothetical protein ACIQAC_37520 [Streptomyces sp. NPDC088387]|uniref:hypothetical protein n=1 Tax=Streptomyces sp. NPDC088387 TaxID=3365859 RepID=UPI00381AEC10